MTDLSEPQISEELRIQRDEIKDRIGQLTTLKGDPDALKYGIKDLQRALLQNPAACSVLLPEDIGAAVAIIRHYTGKEIAEEQVKKSVNKKATKVDLEKIADIPLEDF